MFVETQPCAREKGWSKTEVRICYFTVFGDYCL